MKEILTQNGAVLQSDFLDSFFQKGELIPAVVQETGSKEVLMLAYMNRESLQKTLETGYTWFYSRSRQELWNKGSTSGHLQKVIRICGDCDDDTLLMKWNKSVLLAIPVLTLVFSMRFGNDNIYNT